VSEHERHCPTCGQVTDKRLLALREAAHAVALIRSDLSVAKRSVEHEVRALLGAERELHRARAALAGPKGEPPSAGECAALLKEGEALQDALRSRIDRMKRSGE
jgi:hypothetical protein